MNTTNAIKVDNIINPTLVILIALQLSIVLIKGLKSPPNIKNVNKIIDTPQFPTKTLIMLNNIIKGCAKNQNQPISIVSSKSGALVIKSDLTFGPRKTLCSTPDTISLALVSLEIAPITYVSDPFDGGKAIKV